MIKVKKIFGHPYKRHRNRKKRMDSTNGYDLAIKLRKARRKYSITATEQALYYELVAINNEDGWADIFQVSNDELCRALSITEKTLSAARLTLIQAELIFYCSGKSRRKFGSYSFTKKFPTTVKFPVDRGAFGGVVEGAFGGTNPPDYNKHKQNTNKTKLSDPIGSVPQTEIQDKSEEEKEKKVPRKKRKDGKPHKPFPEWETAVKTWVEYYEGVFRIKPTFEAKEAKALKSIAGRLMKLSKDKEWTDKYCERILLHFFKKAQNDKWLRENYLLPNLSSQFDKIILPDGQANKHNTDAAAGLAAISSMYSGTGK